MGDAEKDHRSSNGDVEAARDSDKSSSHAEQKNEIVLRDGQKIDINEFVPPTPQEEAAVIRKLDFRLVPIVFILYLLSVLDRANLGNAKLAGLEDGESPS